MEPVRDRMLKRFLSLRLLRDVPAAERLKAFQKLAGKYGEKHRRYHVLGHVDFGFQVFDLFRWLAKDPDAFEVAWCYHHIIYDIGVPARQNEQRSAAFIVNLLVDWGIVGAVPSKVASLILATIHDPHRLITDNDEQLIVDIDLAGLGQPWPVFLQNNQNVRQEYKQYSDEDFREGNGKILRQFLERRQLYYHPQIEMMYGDQARDNLTRWLNRP